MGSATPRPPQTSRPPHFDHHRHNAAGHLDDDELIALRDENNQLRELVIQLSKLVIRNALEQK